MIRRDDIIWLAGLLEGEGCFHLIKGKYPIITVNMTAEDTINKVSDMWDRRVIHRGNIWITQVCGAHAVAWMMTLFPFLGRCRKDTIISIIKFWKEYPYSRASKGMRNMSKCHPDRIVYAFDMCKPCYARQWWKEKKLLKKVG